jgi:DTW domain-containing protein YfiP
MADHGMRTLPTEDRTVGSVQRERCYGCFRPKSDCFCAAIPSIANRTEVLILQHMRERFHPFNTARMVQRALRNSRLLVDHTRDLAARLRLKPSAGLLYPGPEAQLISDLPLDQRPKQLVIVDGTWHHAKTLVRDIAALRGLPRYRLTPASPGRYRIRREPTATSLSTVEAAVAALRVLEPETGGLDQLLEAFNCMVERQLAHPKGEYGLRCHKKQGRTFSNIPLALLGNLENVVVAYGESTPRERGGQHPPRSPVYWVAERLGTGERFACAIQSTSPLSDALLEHFELTRGDFSNALPLNEARASWTSFLCPGDMLAVYNQSVADLLTHLGPGVTRCLALKSVALHPHRRHGTLDELVRAEGLVSTPARHPGRAGKRLANVRALVHHLNALGNGAARGEER